MAAQLRGEFTVNQEGVITAASNASIAFPLTSVNSHTGVVVLTSTHVRAIPESVVTAARDIFYAPRPRSNALRIFKRPGAYRRKLCP